jgi:hypothetical protein
MFRKILIISVCGLAFFAFSGITPGLGNMSAFADPGPAMYSSFEPGAGMEIALDSGDSTGDNKESGEKESGDKDSEKASDSADSKVKGPGDMLDIKDGDFRYKRIPGIKLPERKYIQDESIKKDGGAQEKTPAVKGEDTDSGKKGFLGLGKKAADVIAKIILLVIIIVIIVLYKTRSRERHGSVLRRFPKG